MFRNLDIVPVNDRNFVPKYIKNDLIFVEAHPEALVYWEFNGQMVQEINGVVQRQIRGPPKYKVLQLKKILGCRDPR